MQENFPTVSKKFLHSKKNSAKEQTSIRLKAIAPYT